MGASLCSAMKDQEGYERRCLGIDGIRPTARDRWVSFHRLYRAACNAKGDEAIWKQGDIHLAFYCLGGRDIHRWVHLMGEEGPRTWSRVRCYPKMIYKSILESERKRRILGSGKWYREKWDERSKEVSNRMRDTRGMEVTPMQVSEIRAQIINSIRSHARITGIYGLPTDDELLLRQAASSMKAKE